MSCGYIASSMEYLKLIYFSSFCVNLTRGTFSPHRGLMSLGGRGIVTFHNGHLCICICHSLANGHCQNKIDNSKVS